MGRNKSKEKGDRKGTRKRGASPEHNANQSAAVREDVDEPRRKSQRVIKHKFILNKGEIQHIQLENKDAAQDSGSGNLNDCEFERVNSRTNQKCNPDNKVTKVTSLKLDGELGKAKLTAKLTKSRSPPDPFLFQSEHGADRVPADHIDVSVDAQEERDFLDGVVGIDLAEHDLEVEGEVGIETVTTPVEDEHLVSKPNEQRQANNNWIVLDNEIENEVEFENLRGNPAFERYLQKHMFKEAQGGKQQESAKKGRTAATVATPRKSTLKKVPLLEGREFLIISWTLH